MLLGSKSNAFGAWEQCFSLLRVIFGSLRVILIWHVTSFFMAVALVFSGSCYPCCIAFSNALQSYEKFPRYAIAIGKKLGF